MKRKEILKKLGITVTSVVIAAGTFAAGIPVYAAEDVQAVEQTHEEAQEPDQQEISLFSADSSTQEEAAEAIRSLGA